MERVIQQDMAALAPFYRFQTDHPGLFTGLEPLDPQIAVLLLWENVVADPFQISAYFGASSLLADSGVQFDAVFAAKEYLSQGELPMYPAPDFPLEVDQLLTYPVVLIPELNDLIESHAAVLLDYVTSGGVLITYLVDEYGFEFRHTSDPSVTTLLGMIRSGAVNSSGGRIYRLDQNLTRDYRDDPDPVLRQKWLGLLADLGFSPEVRYEAVPMLSAQAFAAEGQLVVHLVNYNWDRSVLSTAPIRDFQVEIALPDGFDRTGLSVTLHVPGQEAVELNYEGSEDGLVFTIPEIQIWSVISIYSAGS